MCDAAMLKRLRREHGLTQREVAESLHMDRSTYAYYEIGQTHPTIEFLLDVSRLYGIRIGKLLGEAPEEPREPSDMFFSQLNPDEKKLVILFRASRAQEREGILAQLEALVR